MIQQNTSEWTGTRGRIGGWFLSSPLRALSENLFLGDRQAAFVQELSARTRGDEVVLDVGAGSGYYSLLVAKQLDRGRVICLDLSEEMLDRLERTAERNGVRDRVEILKGDGAAIQLAPESVDLAVSHSVFHELSRPETVLQEMTRVLKPGGWVIVTDTRTPWPSRGIGARHGDQCHGPFSVGEFESMFGEAGLNRIDVRPIRHWVIGLGQK